MFNRITVAGLAVLAVGLAGCGANTTEQPTPPPAVADKPSVAASPAKAPSSATSAAPASGPKVSPRGMIVKQLGEVGGLTSPDGSYAILDFALTKITPNQQCSQFASTPKGRPIRLDFDITTGPNNKEVRDALAGWSLSGYGMSVVDANGTTTPLSPFYCGIEEASSGGYVPASNYKKIVVIDSPVEHGVLTFAPTGQMGNGVVGWEWSF